MAMTAHAWGRVLIGLLTVLPLLALLGCERAQGQVAVTVPEYAGPAPAAAGARGTRTAVLAGGCFWGVEAVFEHVRGVSRVVSGYAGGTAETAQYERVSAGTTGHAESVEITYDPSQVSYAELLRIFFSVAHDPTQRNRQGPDTGPQYRSAIFYADEAEKATAQAYIEQLDGAKVFSRPVVTEVAKLSQFFPAEAYHQDFLVRNPAHPYIVYHDLPKLAALKAQFPQAYK
jgi:peptide-methionine (S)-S-oxide reductase